MLKEFAVDPAVMASSFETCRYLVDQFGADKGRLISKFPKAWKKSVIQAAAALPDGLKKERVVELVSGLDTDGLALISSNREYPSPEASWLLNAATAHAARPFAAIVCSEDDPSRQLVDAASCDESNPLFAARRSAHVQRKSDELAEPAKLLLKDCRQLRLIDPFFDPNRAKWRNPLAAFLGLIPDIAKVRCEYHILERDGSPSIEELKRRLAQLSGVIPVGGELLIFRWNEIAGGERFHRRLVLTEKAGLSYEGGLDEAAELGQTTDVSILDRAHHDQRWVEYDDDSSVYRLSSPVLVVNCSGQVSETSANEK